MREGTKMNIATAGGALLVAATLACAADFSKMDTDTLLKMRSAMTAPQERHKLHAELQRRMPAMSPAQLERFLEPPRSEPNRGRGMGDGRIATH
jgi:hypothetical protein